MKNVYVILAFHAHELLWDLPETLLSYLDDDNPMKKSFMDENYLKKRKQEGRDIYSLCSAFGDSLGAPVCVEYTNELLVQIKEVLPEVFLRLKHDYARGRLYPVYGHAHHTHVSLLREEEITQEILWNMDYLHNEMNVPYPKYKGLFPPEDSLDSQKTGAVRKAGINYVIFPHLNNHKVPFEVHGEGDCTYMPFFIRAGSEYIIAFPRNFPVSQEIWRPITKMKRDEVKSQGYMLGEYAVFDTEYLTGKQEEYPISLDEGVKMYKEVLRQELEKAPENGMILYVQDLELMDFGDLALDIIEKAWKEILPEEKERYRVHFVTPDTYIDEVFSYRDPGQIPVVDFSKISWAPEIRLILRADGHYPPLGVTGSEGYDLHATGQYERPHVFWENGKYYCGIFDTLLENFGIHAEVPVDTSYLGETGYDLKIQGDDCRAVLYLRLMKRACNWGWRPTEGRQKRPCLKGYLLASLLLEKSNNSLTPLDLKGELKQVDCRNFVGLCEILKVFIDSRLNYLWYGLNRYKEEHGGDLDGAYAAFYTVNEWKTKAFNKAAEMYHLNKEGRRALGGFLTALQDYSMALYMATDNIQRIWSEAPDSEYLVDKMYLYLYDLYPPLFPDMLTWIDSMSDADVEEYFAVHDFSAGKRELVQA